MYGGCQGKDKATINMDRTPLRNKNKFTPIQITSWTSFNAKWVVPIVHVVSFHQNSYCTA